MPNGEIIRHGISIHYIGFIYLICALWEGLNIMSQKVEEISNLRRKIDFLK